MTPALTRRRSLPAPGILQRAVVALSAAALLAPASLAAQQAPASAPLTLEQAVALARANNPAFLQQKNDVDVARSQARSATGNLLPQLNVSNSYSYTASGERRLGSVVVAEQPEYYGSSYNLGVNYQLSGSTLLQPTVERARVRATERQVTGSEATLTAQVAQQYLEVLRAREQVAQAEKEVARTGEHVKLAQARLDVGAGIPLDVRRAEVDQGTAEVALVQARSTAASELLTLSQQLGVELAPDTELSTRFAVFDPSWSAGELVQTAIQNNPQLLAAHASEDAAKTSVKSARSAYLPSLGFNVGFTGSAYQAGNINPLVQERMSGLQGAFTQCQAQNDIRTRVGLAPTSCLNPGDPGVESQIRDQVRSQNSAFPFSYQRQPLQASMTLSLPIFTGFQRQLQIDQAKAQASDAHQQVRAEELRLRQQVGAAVLNLEAQHQTVLLQQKIVANAQEELRLAQERFRFGAANSIEVTDAQGKLAQAERDAINAVYNFHQTLATLEALVGRPLR